MPYDNPFDPSRGGPIMSNLLRALQAKAMIENLKNDALDRQYRQEELGFRREQLGETNRRADERLQFDMGKEGYKQADDALKNTVELHKLGGVMGNPQGEAILDLAFGKVKNPRMSARTPQGETFYLPTVEEQRTTKLQEVVDKGKLGVANKLLEGHAMLKLIQAQAEARKRGELAAGGGPKPPAPRFLQTDKAGMGIDLTTGKPVWTNPDLKRSATAAEKKAPQAQLSTIEAKKADAQQALKEAQYFDTQRDPKTRGFLTPKAEQAYYMALAKAKAAEGEAIALAASLQKLYPKNFSYKVDKDNNIEIDWKD